MWKWNEALFLIYHRTVDAQRVGRPSWREKRIENYIRRRLPLIIFQADRSLWKNHEYKAMINISPARVDIIGDKKQFTETVNAFLGSRGICMKIEHIDDDVDERTDEIPDPTRLIKVYFTGFNIRQTL